MAKFLLWCMGLEKHSIGTQSSLKKKFSFLATILLWCMGVIKISIGTPPSPKQNITVSNYTTTKKHAMRVRPIGNRPPAN